MNKGIWLWLFLGFIPSALQAQYAHQGPQFGLGDVWAQMNCPYMGEDSSEPYIDPELEDAQDRKKKNKDELKKIDKELKESEREMRQI